jgi:hypothetical protein
LREYINASRPDSEGIGFTVAIINLAGNRWGCGMHYRPLVAVLRAQKPRADDQAKARSNLGNYIEKEEEKTLAL